MGDNPTTTPGSLENASVTTWSSQLKTTESHAGEREKFASELIVQISDPLKAAASQYEDIRKYHNELYGKLEKQRESASNDLKKTKGKYDGICQEVESRRKKMESSVDHSKTKAKASYQQHVWDMNNVKNTYLININITNEVKDKFFHEYIPDLLDGLQDLNETRVARLNSIWSLATELDKSYTTNSMNHMTTFLAEIPHNNPQYDSSMFLRHNALRAQEPVHETFQPSPVWHDSGELATDDTAKVFLRNLVIKSKAQVREFRVEVNKKQREVEDAQHARQSIKQEKDSKGEAEMVRSILALKEQLQILDRKLVTAEVEMSTVTAVVGDLSLGARNHNFKAQTFKIPTNCDLCGDRIWGLSAKGCDCRDCGYTCHSKCEMKVPAECPGEVSKEQKKKLKAERQEKANMTPTLDPATTNTSVEPPPLIRKDTMNSLSSGYTANRVSTHRSSTDTAPTLPSETKPNVASSTATAGRRSAVLPPPTLNPPPVNGSSSAKPGEPRGKMIYGYKADGDDEVTVREGEEIVIVEPDGKYILWVTKGNELTFVFLFRWLGMGAYSCWIKFRSCTSILC